MDEVEYCAFILNGLLFGVPIADVQEVLRYQAITYVPRAPKSVSGLINLRGSITTAVDLRARLNLPAREDGIDPMNVVVRSRDGEVVSLLVDRIDDIIRRSMDEISVGRHKNIQVLVAIGIG